MFKSNEGNFSIHIHNINLKAIEQQSNHLITKDTPIFCYVQENKQNFIAKFKDNQSIINITLDTTTQKDEDNNIIPIETKNIFLSFIPFKDNQEANNTIAQKLQLTTQDLNKGYKDINFRIPLLYLKDCEMFREWREEIEEGEDLSGIEVVGKDDMDISLVSEYSKNILRQIAKKSGYDKVVISSTLRTARKQAEAMYNNIINKGIREQRKTYKFYGQKVLDVYEEQIKANKNKEEIIQAMTNKINDLGASNVSKHCADFKVVNVVDIPQSSLGKNKEKFKSEAVKMLGNTNVLDENNCYHIVIQQPQN